MSSELAEQHPAAGITVKCTLNPQYRLFILPPKKYTGINHSNVVIEFSVPFKPDNPSFQKLAPKGIMVVGMLLMHPEVARVYLRKDRIGILVRETTKWVDVELNIINTIEREIL